MDINENEKLSSGDYSANTGFTSMLMHSMRAVSNLSLMSDNERQAIFKRANHIKSRSEMRSFVDKISRGEKFINDEIN